MSQLTASPDVEVVIGAATATPFLDGWLDGAAKLGEIDRGATAHSYRATRAQWDREIERLVAKSVDPAKPRDLQAGALAAADNLVQLLGEHDPEGYGW